MSSSGEACCELLYPVTLLYYFTLLYSDSNGIQGNAMRMSLSKKGKDLKDVGLALMSGLPGKQSASDVSYKKPNSITLASSLLASWIIGQISASNQLRTSSELAPNMFGALRTS